MTIEIIEKNNPKLKAIFEGICISCGSKVRCDFGDLSASNIKYAGRYSEDTYSWEDCPVCNVCRINFNIYKG